MCQVANLAYIARYCVQMICGTLKQVVGYLCRHTTRRLGIPAFGMIPVNTASRSGNVPKKPLNLFQPDSCSFHVYDRDDIWAINVPCQSMASFQIEYSQLSFSYQYGNRSPASFLCSLSTSFQKFWSMSLSCVRTRQLRWLTSEKGIYLDPSSIYLVQTPSSEFHQNFLPHPYMCIFCENQIMFQREYQYKWVKLRQWFIICVL